MLWRFCCSGGIAGTVGVDATSRWFYDVSCTTHSLSDKSHHPHGVNIQHFHPHHPHQNHHQTVKKHFSSSSASPLMSLSSSSSNITPTLCLISRRISSSSSRSSSAQMVVIGLLSVLTLAPSGRKPILDCTEEATGPRQQQAKLSASLERSGDTSARGSNKPEKAAWP